MARAGAPGASGGDSGDGALDAGGVGEGVLVTQQFDGAVVRAAGAGRGAERACSWPLGAAAARFLCAAQWDAATRRFYAAASAGGHGGGAPTPGRVATHGCRCARVRAGRAQR